MGSKVGRTRKWLLAGFAAALVSLALGGCSNYYGYWSGWGKSWADRPPNGQGAYTNADRAKDGGSNALAMVDFTTAPLSHINAPNPANLGLQKAAIGATPVLVRLQPGTQPANADDDWKTFVRIELKAIHDAGFTVLAIQIGAEPNHSMGGPYQFWSPQSYANFFGATATYIRNQSQSGGSLAGFGYGSKIITAGLAPLHKGKYDALAQCNQNGGVDVGKYWCPASYIDKVIDTLNSSQWPNGVAIHLYSGSEHETTTASVALDHMVGPDGEYETFADAVGGRAIWVTEAGSYTDPIDPEWDPDKYQDQESIDVGVVAGLDNVSHEPVGVFGFTLNDIGIPVDPITHEPTARFWGVLDPSNNPKPGLTNDPSSPSAYCVLAALANKPPPSGCSS